MPKDEGCSKCQTVRKLENELDFKDWEQTQTDCKESTKWMQWGENLLSVSRNLYLNSHAPKSLINKYTSSTATKNKWPVWLCAVCNSVFTPTKPSVLLSSADNLIRPADWAVHRNATQGEATQRQGQRGAKRTSARIPKFGHHRSTLHSTAAGQTG